jgi:iron(III) transport system ATP-binding protein
VLFHGKISQFGTPEEVYDRPATPEVAAFIGDARFLRGVANEKRATTVLGELPLIEPAEGAVDVLIRPEMLSLQPYSGEAGDVAGTVASRRFFGRDQQVDLALPDGTEITARVPTLHHFATGDRVTIRVDRPVLAFPTNEP